MVRVVGTGKSGGVLAKVPLIYHGETTVGISNIMERIDKAPLEDQAMMVDSTDTYINNGLESVGLASETWFNFSHHTRVKLGTWNEAEYEQRFGNTYATAQMVKEQRDKKATGKKRVKDAWKSKRGEAFIADVLEVEDLGNSAHTNMGTIAQKLDVVTAIRLLNHSRIERQKEILRGEEAKATMAKNAESKKKTDVATKKLADGFGRRTLEGGLSGDVKWAFDTCKAPDFDIDRQCPLPTKEDLISLRLIPISCGLLVSKADKNEGKVLGIKVYEDEQRSKVTLFSKGTQRIEEVTGGSQHNQTPEGSASINYPLQRFL